jgi:hypothetical protein
VGILMHINEVIALHQYPYLVRREVDFYLMGVGIGYRF